MLHPRPVRRHLAGAADFAARTAGRLVLGAARRGKYLWLPLDSGDAVLGHLGMSGQMLVQPTTAPDERHLRVRFGLEPHQDVARELRFVDQRMFGGLSVSPDGAELPPEIAHIARDPMDPLFDDDAFVARVRRRASAIKRILLDQTVISGVGNIYADEALWRAKVHGERLGTRLRPLDVRRRAGRGPRGDGGRPAGRWHVVRRAVRQRQRAERLLRPVAARLRARGRAVRPLRQRRSAAWRS